MSEKQKFEEFFNDPEIQKLRSKIAEDWEADVQKLVKTMTDEMVKDIKVWRVGKGMEDHNTHSWRSLASEFVQKYSGYSTKHGIQYGNQLCGMQLCDAAMIRLNEKNEDGWN